MKAPAASPPGTATGRNYRHNTPERARPPTDHGTAALPRPGAPDPDPDGALSVAAPIVTLGELAQQGAKGGAWGAPRRALWDRFFMMENIYEQTISETEAHDLCDALGPDSAALAARYLCWRNSTLQVALPMYLCSLVLLLSTSWRTLDPKNSVIASVLQPQMFTQYRHYFETYFSVSTAVTLLYWLSLGVSLLCWVRALCNWKRGFHASKRAIRLGYMIAFGVPYVLTLLVPFKSLIDTQGFTAELCASAIPQLDEQLMTLNCSADPRLCKLDSSKWADSLTRTISGCGLLKDKDTGTCPAAKQAAEAQLLTLSGMQASNPPPSGAVQQGLCEKNSPCGVCASDGCRTLSVALARPDGACASCWRSLDRTDAWQKLSQAEQNSVSGAGLAQLSCVEICASAITKRLPIDMPLDSSLCMDSETWQAINERVCAYLPPFWSTIIVSVA